jgi:thiol:disulfide interchange protein
MTKKFSTGLFGVIILAAVVASSCLISGQCQANTKEVSAKVVETSSKKKKPAPKKIQWITSISEAQKLSKSTGKPIFVDFFATWCPPCKMLESQTYPNAKVVAESQKWIMVKVDTDKQVEVAGRYGITNLPTLAVLDSNGKPLIATYGFLQPDDFLDFLKEAKTKVPKK